MPAERDTVTAALVAVVREAVRAELAELQPAAAKPALLDCEALARELGVSIATIRRLAKRGSIPFVLVGESHRFRLEVVLAALESPNAKPKLRSVGGGRDG